MPLSSLVDAAGFAGRRVERVGASPAQAGAYRVVVWEGLRLAGGAPLYTVQRLLGVDELDSPDRALPESPCAGTLADLRRELESYREALSRPWLVMYGLAYEEWLPPCVMRYRELADSVGTDSDFCVGMDGSRRFAVYRVLNDMADRRVVAGPWALVARSEVELMAEMARYVAALDRPVLDLGSCEVQGQVLQLRY